MGIISCHICLVHTGPNCNTLITVIHSGFMNHNLTGLSTFSCKLRPPGVGAGQIRYNLVGIHILVGSIWANSIQHRK